MDGNRPFELKEAIDVEGNSQESVRVMVVDDHELFRNGVCGLLSRTPGIEVVAEAENGRLAWQRCQIHNPHVILMDINMPVMDGLEATQKIKSEFPDVKILILTVSDTEEMLFQAVKSGASGYVLKNAEPSVVIDALKRVSAGEPVIPGNLAMQIITEFSRPATSHARVEQANSNVVESLTAREIEVLQQLSTGATNRDIAQALYISENTVRNHVRNILDKLHLTNRVEAATYALREGIVRDAMDEYSKDKK